MILLSILFAVVLVVAALLLMAHLKTRRIAAEAVRLVPQLGQKLSVDGGEIHYHIAGPEDGRPMVMLHGLSGQLQHYTYALSSELDGEYRLIMVDRPGCGYSSRETVQHGRLPEQARMIWEALDQLGVERPVLVGHSLGGAVALAMALQRPQAVAGLALLCPATTPQNDVPPVFKGLEIRSDWLRRLISQTIAVPGAVATRDKVLGMAAAPEPVPEGFMIRGGAQLGFRPEAFVTASEDLLGYEASMPALAPRYGELTMPRAVLFGDKDAVLDPNDHGRSLESFGFVYEELPDLGHLFPLTTPGPTASFIRRLALRAHQEAGSGD